MAQPHDDVRDRLVAVARAAGLVGKIDLTTRAGDVLNHIISRCDVHQVASMAFALAHAGLIDEAEIFLMSIIKRGSGAYEFKSRMYLASILQAIGRVSEAETCIAAAVSSPFPEERQTAARFAAGLSLYHGSTENSWRRHLEIGRVYARHARPDRYRNPMDPGRRLRIGYLSKMFGMLHAFVPPVLRCHDRDEVEVVVLDAIPNPNRYARAAHAAADRVLDLVCCKGGRDAAALIEEARIDVLVDLDGHFSSAPDIMAHKPAPVQVHWVGYPGSTGLGSIDYRLSDAECEPPGDADGRSSERIWRLPRGFHCFGAPQDAPDVAPPPIAARGTVTFGSFNNPLKLAPETIALWGRVLAAVPGARLLLKGSFMFDSARHHLGRFVAAGVDPGRVTILPYMSDERAHLAAYGEIDVALDPFPYNGTTTTCEALWQGVPVVTLAGDRHVARVGVSLMTRVGLPELIANTPDEYVAIAAGLARDRERLAGLRAGMRVRMRASPLMDGPGMARDIEAAYREMWRRWCATAAWVVPSPENQRPVRGLTVSPNAYPG